MDADLSASAFASLAPRRRKKTPRNGLFQEFLEIGSRPADPPGHVGKVRWVHRAAEVPDHDEVGSRLPGRNVCRRRIAPLRDMETCVVRPQPNPEVFETGGVFGCASPVLLGGGDDYDRLGLVASTSSQMMGRPPLSWRASASHGSNPRKARNEG